MDPTPRSTGGAGRAASPSLPLALPQAVWDELSAEQHATYDAAQAVLDALPDRGELRLRQVIRATGRGGDSVLRGLRLLDALELVAVRAGDRDPVIRCRARPEGHVRIIGPDGEPHWVFVARPVEEPEVPPELLN